MFTTVSLAYILVPLVVIVAALIMPKIESAINGRAARYIVLVGISLMMAGIAIAGHALLSRYYIEQWLREDPVYPILFADFSADKSRFIDEYHRAYKVGGEEAVNEKVEEMKIIMWVNHLQSYVDDVPAALVTESIRKELALRKKLLAAPGDICSRYLSYTGHFREAWDIAGDAVFLDSIATVPEMIVAARANPEPMSPEDRKQAKRAYEAMWKEVWNRLKQKKIDGKNYKDGNNPCTINLTALEYLHSRPGKDSVLAWKYWYGTKEDKGDKPKIFPLILYNLMKAL